MIELNLIGALGNQMFEYAFARSLSLENNREPIIVNGSYNTIINRAKTIIEQGKYYPSHLFGCRLGDFYAGDNIVMMSKAWGALRSVVVSAQHYALIRKYKNFDVVSDHAKIEMLFKQSSKSGKYYLPVDDQKFYFWEPESSTEYKKILSGTFQSEQYFYKHRQIIKEELKVKTPPSERNRTMIEDISGCNAVCVHMRTGFFTESNMVQRQRFVCNEVYYRNAMRYVAKCTTDPVFYIFSDDIEYARTFLKFEYPVRYVDLNNVAFEEIRLMYTCKHFIICNSSFSWWASYLSDNNDKIVCAPNVWHKEDAHSSESDIYRKDMIKIDIENDCRF